MSRSLRRQEQGKRKPKKMRPGQNHSALDAAQTYNPNLGQGGLALVFASKVRLGSDVSMPPIQRARVSTPPTGGGEPAAPHGRVEFRHRLPLRRKAGREDRLVPVAGDEAPAIARELVGRDRVRSRRRGSGRSAHARTAGRKRDRGQIALVLGHRAPAILFTPAQRGRHRRPITTVKFRTI